MSFERLRGPGRRIFAAVILMSLLAGCETASVAPNPPPAPAMGVNVYEPGALDRKPVARVQKRPDFPFEMRRAGVSGEVVVEFVVDPNGNVQQARAVSATTPEFADAGVQCIIAWKFSPGMKNGQPVATIMQMPFSFGLNEGR